MLDDYKNGQPVAYNLMLNSIKKNKLSHAYLIESNNNPDALDIALAFVKAIICPYNYTNRLKCQQCNLCKRIDDHNYLELKIINPEGMWIKKEQTLDLQEEFSKMAIEGNKKIYIIMEAEKMNVQTANSILKFLEEPNENIIAILITNNINKMLKTIISRCQIIGLVKKSINSYNTFIEKIGSIVCNSNNEITDFITNKDSQIMIDNVIYFIDFYTDYGLDTLIYTKKLWHNNFKEKKECLIAIDIMISFYYDVLKYKINKKTDIFSDNNKLIDKVSLISEQELSRKLQVLIEIKEMIRYNLNMNLLIDKMIIDLEGV